MRYEVWIHYGGDYSCEVEANNEDEAQKIALLKFRKEDMIPETYVDDYTVYELNEEE